ncbi:hypothetical protein BC567DRAFT_238361, partial [Phyllosticta citribraziliensis]
MVLPQAFSSFFATFFFLFFSFCFSPRGAGAPAVLVFVFFFLFFSSWREGSMCRRMCFLLVFR